MAKRPRWTVIANATVEDDRLSFRALGLLAYLLSKPDDWRVDYRELAKSHSEGEHAVQAGLRELTAAGYFKRERHRTEGGKFRYEHVLYETAQPGEPEGVDAETATRSTVTRKPRRGSSSRSKDCDLETENQELEPAPIGARADQRADLLVKAWWEERKTAGNPPAQSFIACRKVVEAVLRNGVSESRVEWALRHVPVVSSGAIEMAIQREIDRRDPTARAPRPSRQDEAVQRMKARAAERIAEQRGHIIDVHETRGLGA